MGRLMQKIDKHARAIPLFEKVYILIVKWLCPSSDDPSTFCIFCNAGFGYSNIRAWQDPRGDQENESTFDCISRK